MTAYAEILTESVETDAPISASLLVRLRNNPIAMFEGASGAPRLSHLALETLTAGNILHAIAPGPYSDTDNVYNKYDEFTLTRAGILRVAFTLLATSGTAYGRIYKNGVAFGTERTTTGLATFTEDLAFARGDTCELWLKTGSISGTTATATNFKLSAAQYPLTTVAQRQV